MSRIHTFAVLCAAALLFCFGATGAAETTHEHAHAAGSKHMSHPLLIESPTPDTKVRLAYIYTDEEHALEHELELELEYAFHRAIGFEVGLPFANVREGGEDESGLGNIELGVKVANFAFEESGVVLTFIMEVGIPSGNEEDHIGSDHIVTYEPGFAVGYQKEKFQFVGLVAFGIPTNQQPGEEFETELEANVSGLYRFNDYFEALIEVGVESVLSGDERGETEVVAAPGVKLNPTGHDDLEIGANVIFALSDDSELDIGASLSVFKHF